MTSEWIAKLSLALFLAGLCACQTPSKHEEQPRAPQVRLSKSEVSPPRSATSDNNCELDDFPVSKSTDEILAAVPREATTPSNQMMIAKIAVNSEGSVTHLRVMRLAWPNLPNSRAINKQTVDSIKRWHYTPKVIDGKPVPTCNDVGVTVDLQ